jgi:hypothetical protein
MTRKSVIRKILPLGVSGLVLGLVLLQVDGRALAAAFTRDAAAALGPAVLLYAAATLAIEAVSLRRLIPASASAVDLATCARIKAASYLLGVVHYGLGAGALTILLCRRASLSVSAAAGVVMGLLAADVSILGTVALLAASTLATDAPPLRASLVLGVVLGFVLALAALRSRRGLGRLEALRGLEVFRALRTAPTRALFDLLALRTLFVVCYVGVLGVAMASFGIRVEPARLVVGLSIVTLVAALPIALAGLGTSQAAFVYVFREAAPAEMLLACSLSVSAAFLVVRTAIGLLFAREYAREAARASREEAAR